jgi:hypothetical protein
MIANLALIAALLPHDEVENLQLPTWIFGPPGEGPSSHIYWSFDQVG